MQFSNDNFDELFQKAAEDYPLKTDNSNWDTVAAKLHTTVPSQAITQSRKWQYAALLLLLLSGAFFAIRKYSNSSTELKLPAQQDQKALPGNKDNDKPLVEQKQPGTSSANNNTTAAQSVSVTKKPAVSLLSVDKTISAKAAGQRANQELDNKLTQLQKQSEPQPQQNILFQPDQNHALSKTDQGNSNQQINPGLVTNNNKPANKPDNNKTVPENGNNIKQQQANKKNEVAQKTPIKLLPRQTVIYGSLFIAPELSTVKFQHTDKLGYKVGVSLGYRINNRFNIELGLQREHKNFFSDGQYFDRSQLRLKESTSIEALNGSAKITEVPITLRYNFSPGNKGQFFAAGGVNAVLVTHLEKYNYAVTKDGEPQNLSRNFSAAATKTKYFSGANFSMGYETPLFNFGKLKVEPYYQMSLKGVGVGNLPINSFGINIGISKDLK